MADITTRLHYLYDPSGVNQAISGTSKLAQNNQRVESTLGSVAKSAAGFGLAMVGVSSIAATVRGVFNGVVGSAADFEQQMNILQAVTGASAEDIARLDKEAVKLGADLSLPATSALDASRAMTELSKAGLSVENVLGAAKGTLQLAAAANIGEARAAEIAANALNAFSLDGGKATKVADLLAASANASSGEITDMADAMQMSSAVFASLGFNIEELTTAIALMANRGIQGSDAGTSLKQAMLALINPTAKAKGALRDMGVSIRDQAGEIKPLRTLVNEFTTATQKMGAEQRDAALDTIFGSDAIRAAFTVLTAGVDQYDAMFEAVTKVSAAEELAASRTKGLAGAWEGLKSQLETLGLIAGRPLLAPITRAVRGLAIFVGSLAEAFDSTNDEVTGFALAIRKIMTPISALGRQFVALIRYLGHVIEDGDTLNDWLTHLSPAFQIVAMVIGTTISQLQFLARMIADVVRSPLARWIGDLVSALLNLVFGVREASNGLQAMAAPLSVVSAGLTGLLTVLAVTKVLDFVGAMASLARNILLFPIRPLIDAAVAVANFASESAKLASKAITITANVITKGAELAAELFQTVTQFVKRTGDKFLGPDDLMDKTQTITQKVDVKSPPDSVVTGLAEKFGNLFGGVLVGLGVGIGARLWAAISESVAGAGISETAILAALAKFGGPVGKGIAISAAAAFVAFFPEQVGALGGAIVAMTIDLEGWRKSVTVLQIEGKKAIDGWTALFKRGEEEWEKLPITVGTFLATSAVRIAKFIDDHRIIFPRGIREFIGAGLKFFIDLPDNIGLELAKAGNRIGTWLAEQRAAFGRWVIDSLAEIVKLSPWDALRSGFEFAKNSIGQWFSDVISGFRNWASVLMDIIRGVRDFLSQPFQASPAPSAPTPAISAPAPEPIFTFPEPIPNTTPLEGEEAAFQTPIGGFRAIPGSPGQPQEITAHGGEIIGRPAADLFSAPSVNVTIQMGGVTVSNEADEQRLISNLEQRLLDSLNRILGQGTPWPHGLNVRT